MKKFILLIALTVSSISFSQTELTDENAEDKLITNTDRLIVVDFYATWCGPCKQMDPIMKELEFEYGNSIDFYKIDVDKNKVDDALGITAMPTYTFIKRGSILEQVEGAMSKSDMEALILKHYYGDDEVEESTYAAENNHGNDDEYSQSTIDEIWDSYSNLNSLAWHAYLEHNDINVLLKSIKIIERSIELEATYYNVDTHAALLYKTGNYTKALKKAKEAIEIAKNEGEDYSSTSDLIGVIIDKL